MSLTRRALLERLGLAGGVSAVYLGMEAMGLLNAPPAAAEPFELPPAAGRRRIRRRARRRDRRAGRGL